MAGTIDRPAAENGSARDSLVVLNDLLSSVCISPPVEESVTRLLDLAAYVVTHYAQEESMISEDSRKYRKEKSERPEMEAWGPGRKNSAATGSKWSKKRSDVRNESSFREKLIAEYRSLQDLVETKSREIFDRLGQLLGGTVSHRLQRAGSSGSGTIYLDADDQQTRVAEFEGENGFSSDWSSEERVNVDNNDNWGNSTHNEENGWGDENDGSGGWNRESGRKNGWGNENRDDSGWGNESEQQDGLDSGNEASGGWGNENGGNNDWTIGNGGDNDQDRQDDRSETNDGWGNADEQNSGGNDDDRGNNSWGNGNNESGGWGNSENVGNGWANSPDVKNEWDDKTPTNESSLLTEDLSDNSSNDVRKDTGWTRHYPDDEFEFSQATTVSAVPPYRRELNFSGYKWHVKHSEHGLEMFDARNAWVDRNGQLHLKLTVFGGRWFGSYIYSDSAFGFGDYTFDVIGNVNALDPHVSFGMASYLEKSGRNAESIHMTFAKWGDVDELPGEYVVQPMEFAAKPVWFQKFDCRLEKSSSPPYTVHKMYRDDLRVVFRSTQETIKSGSPRRDHQFAGSVCVPQDPYIEIPQRPMPVHFSLSASIPPTDGEEVEMIIPSFEFSSL